MAGAPRTRLASALRVVFEACVNYRAPARSSSCACLLGSRDTAAIAHPGGFESVTVRLDAQ